MMIDFRLFGDIRLNEMKPRGKARGKPSFCKRLAEKTLAGLHGFC
ncbi:MAG TPA: hypothetical protein PKA41_05210 [Verrucomicrobiota bacterium]|nr:hypothetical protein [Verrucomicrobiota bacterium]